MNTRKGKGYFYARGQRDAAAFKVDCWFKLNLYALRRNAWPQWAKIAYINGFNGWGL